MTAPKIRCLVPSSDGYVPVDASTCHAAMRLSRLGAPSADDAALSYGQYFRAISDVMARDAYGPLVRAAAKQSAQNISLTDIDEIRVYAEKHGSDYHPARIEVKLSEGRAVFAMNVAVTPRGKARMDRECRVLRRLNSRYDYPFLPRVYFRDAYSGGTGQCDKGGDTVTMFLADWFEGYHEFHLSIDQTDGTSKLILWDTEKGPCFLQWKETMQVYHQAAEILTLYYDVETFEQIFPWHHGAGDFVIKIDRDGVGVRLVTARQYASMLDPCEEISAHEALLFFLLNLSVRMRLDRLDGVGSIAWADENCLEAVFKGFARALRIKECDGRAAPGFVDAFFQYCAGIGQEDLSHMFYDLVAACDPRAPDMPVIKRHLTGHLSAFYSTLQSLEVL